MENSKKQGKKKILDEDLAVSKGGCGGGCSKYDPHKDMRFVTKMKCKECECMRLWEGDFYDDKDYPCPRCGKMSFRGFGYQCRPIDV